MAHDSFYVTFYTYLIALHLWGTTKNDEINTFMVEELDGTVNEWGWCKQKVVFVASVVLLELFNYT